VASRDDMVIRPRLDGGDRAAAPVRAREERRLYRGKKKGRLFGRMVKARMGRKAARRAGGALKARRAAKLARASRAAAGAGRGAAAAAARGGARAAASNPIGWIVAAVVVVGAVAGRLISGRSFENMGANINKVLLGDLDEQARAASDTRQRFAGDSQLAEIVGKEGRVNSQVSSIFTDLKNMRERELRGASLFREDKAFQGNSTILDQLIVRGADAIKKGWDALDGNGRVEKLGKNYKAFGNAAEEHGAR